MEVTGVEQPGNGGYGRRATRQWRLRAERNPAMEGYGRRATRRWRVAGIERPCGERTRAESDPVIGGLRHRANRRGAGELRRPADGLAALLGRFLDHAGGDLAELLVAWRGRCLWFGLLLLFFSAFVFVSHGDSLTPMS